MQPSVTAATPTAVQAPTTDQTPTTAQTPTTGQAPTPGQTPTAGQNPTAGQTPNAGVRTSRLGGYRVFESQFTNATSSSRTPQMRKSKCLFHLIILFIVAYKDQCDCLRLRTFTPLLLLSTECFHSQSTLKGEMCFLIILCICCTGFSATGSSRGKLGIMCEFLLP